VNEQEAALYAKLEKELNKEDSVVTYLGDLYVNLLRYSRSRDRHYLAEATESLLAFLDTLALGPKTPLMEVVDRASQRVGWQEQPKSEYHQALNGICKSAITYMIEASDYSGGNLLSKRATELVQQIECFISDREEKRKRR
jgi:hypothetical protein